MKRNLTYFFIFAIAIFSCKSKTKNSNSSNTNPVSVKNTISTKAPDTNLAIKSDFTQLTKEEEEREDKSHMDMSYFPSNYALEKALGKPVQLSIRAIYSRPHKGARTTIFGDSAVLVPYGKLWRLGANETTEIEFLRPVMFGNKKVNPGRYTLYAIPYKDKWTVILNKELYTFGDFNYNELSDIVRATAVVNKAKFKVETFFIYFQKTNNGCNLTMCWDDVVATLPIGF